MTSGKSYETSDNERNGNITGNVNGTGWEIKIKIKQKKLESKRENVTKDLVVRGTEAEDVANKH